MPGSFLVARILGIDIRIHLSWVIVFTLVLLSLTDRVFPELYPYWSQRKVFIVGAIAALLFFVSILLHELAHAIVARLFHMPVSSITLFLLGGVANLAKEPPSAKAEFLMAGAGPLMSLVLGGLGFLVAWLSEVQLDTFPALEPVQAVAGYLGFINIALAIFNMVPGFPLDGGRVLRSAVWAIKKDRAIATRIAAYGGQFVALLLFGGGLVRLFMFGDPVGGVWYSLIAYFLYNAASSSIQQERISASVGGVRVRQLMTSEFRTVPPGLTIASLIRDLFLPFNVRAVPVVAADRILGLVTIGDLRKVSQEQWPTARVEEVMTKAQELGSVTPDDPLTLAIELFQTAERPLLPVVENGALVGLLDRESVVSYVRMREMLGVDRKTH